MNRLNDTTSSVSYTQQLANVYKQVKVGGKSLSSSQKIQAYFNKETGVLEIFQSKADVSKGFKRLNQKKLYKHIKTEIDRGDVNQKMARTAAKALISLPWKKSFDIQQIKADFPVINQTISHQKATELDKMLDRIETIRRSEEGGNGVIFIDCMPMEGGTTLYEGGIVIKLLSDAEPVVVADRLLKTMGFNTPKSCYLPSSSLLKRKFMDQTLVRLHSIDETHHLQIRSQIQAANSLLVMNTLSDAISLRQMDEGAIHKIMKNQRILQQLGRMILSQVLNLV